MEDLVGKSLGQYRIEAKIGEGGMAAVFKAYQPSLDRHVAIKVLPSAVAKDSSFVTRFQREAKSIARLTHPHILPVYDFGIDQGYSYIVMRYVANGHTLSHLMGLAISRERAIELLSQIANALNYAHKHNVIHRDVKPDNVLLDEDWPLLSDFGLAKITRDTSTRITTSGTSIGTPAYMSPEQGSGETVDHRTDIYALGVILYEMLTRTIPHAADTPYAIILKRNVEPPPSPRIINPDIPESINQVVLRSLATNPKHRYDTASDFAIALRKAAADESYQEPILLETAHLQVVTRPVTSPVGAPQIQTPPALEGDQATISMPTKPPPPGRFANWRNLWLILGGFIIMGALIWGGFARSSALTEAQINSAETDQILVIAPTSTDTPTITPTARPTNTSIPATNTPLPIPVVKRFLAVPTAITAGQSVTLEWEVEGADSVSVAPLGAGFPPVHSLTHAPANNTTYILTASKGSTRIEPVSLQVFVTPIPTDTPIPAAQTPIPSPTATPTPLPTPTLAPPAAVPTVTPTPTPQLPTGTFTLLNPLALDEPTFGPTEFEWDWIGTVPPELGFEIRVWRDGEFQAGAHDAVLDNKEGRVQKIGPNSYRLTLDITEATGVQRRSGLYLWTVALVQITPEYADLGQSAQPAQLRFELPGGSGDGGGDGGSSGPKIN